MTDATRVLIIQHTYGMPGDDAILIETAIGEGSSLTEVTGIHK